MNVLRFPIVRSSWADTPKSTTSVHMCSGCNDRHYVLTAIVLFYLIWCQHCLWVEHSALWYHDVSLCSYANDSIPENEGVSDWVSEWWWEGAGLTLRTSREMYAIQSSLSERDLVDLTRSVTEPAPQYSITSWKEKKKKIVKTLATKK